MDDMKEVVCRVCQVNKVKISAKGTSGVCLECVSGGALVVPLGGLQLPKKVRAKRGSVVRPERKPRNQLLAWGEVSAWVRSELKAGKGTKDIYHVAMTKWPDYDKKKLRSSVYTTKNRLNKEVKREPVSAEVLQPTQAQATVGPVENSTKPSV